VNGVTSTKTAVLNFATMRTSCLIYSQE